MIKSLFFIFLFIGSSVFAESAYDRAHNTFWRISFDNPAGDSIPGYQWRLHFTHDFKPIIADELSKWQINDALINQAWTRGLFREREKPAEKAKLLMDKLYQEFLEAKKKDEIIWVKLQMKPGAHSALIIDMIPSADNTSYKIETIDSNSSTANTYYSYEKEAQVIFRVDIPSEKSLPWSGFERDLRSIKKALLKNQKGSQ